MPLPLHLCAAACLLVQLWTLALRTAVVASCPPPGELPLSMLPNNRLLQGLISRAPHACKATPNPSAPPPSPWLRHHFLSRAAIADASIVTAVTRQSSAPRCLPPCRGPERRYHIEPLPTDMCRLLNARNALGEIPLPSTPFLT